MKKYNGRYEIRINQALVDQLTQVAKTKKVKPSEYIRMTINEEYLKHLQSA